MMDTKRLADKARGCTSRIGAAYADQKNTALLAMAALLKRHTQKLVDANAADVAAASQRGLADSVLRRLVFNEGKIASRVQSLCKIAALDDPVGQRFSTSLRPNGLEVARVRVPLGVILMIYEARPHVTVNAGAFCLKAGNAAILRGGSEAARCNGLLGELWCESLVEAGLPEEAIQITACSHEQVNELLQMDDKIDLVIPRGGRSLIEAVAEQSRVPVIKHYDGLCHVYIDETADSAKAIDIAIDSKCLMPEVCNAMETLLVSDSRDDIARIVDAFRSTGVTVKGCEKIRAADPNVLPAEENDWQTEYLDMVVSIKCVTGLDAAIEHINHYGSHHTDSLVTDSQSCARRFVQEVDSSVVLVNASTMFCDGETLGMGAEIGISTGKLHARGPMGLQELTSYKFVVQGDGHIMGEADSLRRSKAGI